MKILVLLILSVSFLGCAGLFRSADPVAVYQYGDEVKSCDELEDDLRLSLIRLDDMQMKRKTKIASNAMLTGTGLLLFPPLLLGLDLSDVDLTNIKAERKRYHALAGFARDKDCGFEIVPLPSVETNKQKPVMSVSRQH